VPFSLHLTARAKATLGQLERDTGLAKRLFAVRKTLARLESNPRHPGLQSHRGAKLNADQSVRQFQSDLPVARRKEKAHE